MIALSYIGKAIKEFILQIILIFDNFDYSAIFPEGNNAFLKIENHFCL